MNARFAVCAKRWLLSAAAGLLVIPPTTVLLWGSTSGSPSAEPPWARQEENANSMQTVSYTPDTAVPRTLDSRSLATAQTAAQSRPPASGAKGAEKRGPLAAVFDLFNAKEDSPCLKGDCDLRTDPPQLVPRPQSLYPQPRETDRRRRSVRQIAQHQHQTRAPRERRARSGQSSILEELRKLYRRDGIDPPEMDLSKFPDTPEEAQRAIKERDLQMKKRRSARRRESSEPGLLQRIFSFGKSDRRQQRSHRPRPIESTTPSTRQGHQHGRPGRRTGPELYRRPATLSRQPGARRPGGARRPDRSRRPGPQFHPAGRQPGHSNPAPRDWADLDPDPVGGQSGKARQPSSQPSPTSRDPLSEDSLFPEMSEAEADSAGRSPFTGEKLADEADSLDWDSDGTGKPEPEGEDAQPDEGIAWDEPDEESHDGRDVDEADSQENGLQAKFRRIAARSGMSGFKGFCPVALRDRRELVDSNPEHHARFESRTYHFSTAEAKAAFESDPKKYAPAYGGRDAVLLAQGDEEVEGALDYAVWFQDRLYLFNSAETLQQFVLSPDEYAESG